MEKGTHMPSPRNHLSSRSLHTPKYSFSHTPFELHTSSQYIPNSMFAFCFNVLGDEILNGGSKFSLDTYTFLILAKCFEDVREDDLTTSFDVLPGFHRRPEIFNHSEFLYDLVQKAKCFKVLTIAFVK